MDKNDERLERNIKLVIAAAVIIYLFVKLGGGEKYYCTWTGCNNRTSTRASFCNEHQRYIDNLLSNSRKASKSNNSNSSSRTGSSSSGSGSSSRKSSSSSSKSSGSGKTRDSYNDGYDDIYLNEDYDQDRYDRDILYANGVDDAMEDMDW